MVSVASSNQKVAGLLPDDQRLFTSSACVRRKSLPDWDRVNHGRRRSGFSPGRGGVLAYRRFKQWVQAYLIWRMGLQPGYHGDLIDIITPCESRSKPSHRADPLGMFSQDYVHTHDDRLLY